MPNPLADELQTDRRARPSALVIFGASGDLTRRKQVPSLMGLAQDGLLPPRFAVVGFARRDWSQAEFRRRLEEGVEAHGREGAGDAFAEWQGRFSYFEGDYDDPESYRKLADHLDEVDQRQGTQGNRIFYLATPPAAYQTILGHLHESGLSTETDTGPGGGTFARVIVEKPFGKDLDTAQALNAQVLAGFNEHQVFRIDHYLGKETVQNILALRFANSIFEPLWNHHYIDHVQITVAESIGIEGRGGYFDNAGIIRDMIQNHLLQVLTLVAMEPPVSSSGDSIRDEKVKVLRAIRSLTPEKVAASTVRGRYTAGWSGGDEGGHVDFSPVIPLTAQHAKA